MRSTIMDAMLVATRSAAPPRAKTSLRVTPPLRAATRVLAAIGVVVGLPSAVAAAPVGAQVGTAVAVAPVPGRTVPDVVVLRPTADRGMPAVLVYRHGSDGWSRLATLAPAAMAAPYEGFGPSIAVDAAGIVVAAADAQGAWAGNRYEAGDGGWAAVGRIPMNPESTPDATEPEALDMGGLMRIMRPPRRVVASSPSGALMAVWAERAGGAVRVLRRTAPGGWETDARLAPGDGSDLGPVAALVLREDRLMVGAPERGGSGRVLVFAHHTGTWSLETELAPDPDAADARFGSSLAYAGDRLVVGAPGTGEAHVFRRSGAAWTRTAVVAPASGRPGVGTFGVAVAMTRAELWVGDPLAGGGAGAVHRYRRSGADGVWQPQAVLRGDSAGDLFGVALALTEQVAIVGAPGPPGHGGGAAVLRREGDGWSGVEWLRPGGSVGSVTGGVVRCESGAAAGFDCHNVDLLTFLSLDALDGRPGHRVSDVWGWTDPETGREFALVGITAGMAVVDVTDPESPVYMGLVPANPSGARDIKTYRNHAFFTGDGAGDHGLVVFDLTRLRDPRATPIRFEPNARYTGIASAHNLIMDPETGIAIPVGSSGGGQTCGGGLHMLDVTTPTEPTFLGCYTDDIGLIAPGRTHDGQCVVYHGPDARYAGREICFASNETALRIVDITAPDSVAEVALATYPGTAYTHQGWLTDDHRYFFMNDELDEMVGITERTRTLVWDVAELDDPVLMAEHFGADGATDHNLFIRGDRMYQANYQAGLRVIDISDPLNPVEIGFFDTTPYEGNPPGFGTGAWTAYPYLESGTVLVTSMYEGLFVLRPRGVVP